jgi:cytochrome c oxidase cbb3-type subunit III
MRLWLKLCCLALVGLAARPYDVLARAEGNAQNPLAGDRAAVEAGASSYDAMCSGCHGMKGKGDRAPKLAGSDTIRGMTDKEIFAVIHSGVSGTEMPGFPLSERQTWELVAFIRNLNAAAFQQDVPGDAAAGQALFYGAARCSSCHMIDGKGGLLGPDLSNLGAERSVEQITESLRNPSAEIALRYRHVRVMTRDGRSIDGLLKNDSTYSIQILDLNATFHLLLKSDLQKIVYYRESLMPAVTLPEKDFQNLLAYLSRQVRRPDSAQRLGVSHILCWTRGARSEEVLNPEGVFIE